MENIWWNILEVISYLISLNHLLLKSIAQIGSWKHFVFVFVCVSLSLYLPFCKSSPCSLSSPDDKLSEIISFVWSRTSYSGDSHHVGRQTTEQGKMELFS